MKHVLKKAYWVLIPMGLWLGGCNKSEQNVTPTDDNEAITTATLSLTNTANRSEVVTATIDNLNTTANFANATLKLKPNTTYSGTVSLLDKTKTPTVDATEEIREKLNEHLFVYKPSTGLNLTVTITDKDTNPSPGPYPVGLTYTLATTGVSTGSLNVVLRHQPNAKNGTATPGTSDLDTAFPVVIQ